MVDHETVHELIDAAAEAVPHEAAPLLEQVHDHLASQLAAHEGNDAPAA